MKPITASRWHQEPERIAGKRTLPLEFLDTADHEGPLPEVVDTEAIIRDLCLDRDEETLLEEHYLRQTPYRQAAAALHWTRQRVERTRRRLARKMRRLAGQREAGSYVIRRGSSLHLCLPVYFAPGKFYFDLADLGAGFQEIMDAERVEWRAGMEPTVKRRKAA